MELTPSQIVNQLFLQYLSHKKTHAKLTIFTQAFLFRNLINP